MDKHSYWVYAFAVTGEARQALVAQLETLPTLGFEETDTELITYLDAAQLSEDTAARLALLAGLNDLNYRREFLPGQNWNAQWEASFQPIRIADFVGIRAEFHPPFTDVEHELLIHPRMAFGTGHHATTYLVMERMRELDFAGKAVFDYGCGTGILAILARMLGAGPITAVDIEEAATENTFVNMAANQVSGIEIFTGDINAVPETKNEIILANINRNVILASLGALYARIAVGGDLLVSGILEKDQEIVDRQAKKEGWQKVLTRSKDGWLLLHYRRD